jgi:quinol-cytochrome oxidoreductase complex cytochrome b subunit
MQVSRLTLGGIAVGWFVFLLGAAFLLPPLDSHASVQPTVKAAFAVIGALFVIGTLVALMSYFMQAWQRLSTVPNRTAYMVWIGLETVAALFVLFGLAYSTVIFAVTRFR